MRKMSEIYPPLDPTEIGTLSWLMNRAQWNFHELATLRESERGSRALDALLSLVKDEREISGPYLDRALRVLERDAKRSREKSDAAMLRRHRGESEPKPKRRPKLTVVGE